MVNSLAPTEEIASVCEEAPRNVTKTTESDSARLRPQREQTPASSTRMHGDAKAIRSLYRATLREIRRLPIEYLR